MPTYEYKCKKCGYEFERFQKITADPVATCPECGGSVERLITKGGGFTGGERVRHAAGKRAPAAAGRLPVMSNPAKISKVR
jgi:putative FmdB family regulatory protein